MARAHFQHAKISALSTSVGPVVKRIDDEIEFYGGNAAQLERIKKTIGLNERRVVQFGTTTADLCLHATRRLIAGGGLDIAAVDGLVFVTQTPDYIQPCNAALLHGRLGLSKDCAAFDVNLGCSGFVYGLYLANLMVEAGGCHNVLLMAGDTISLCVNPRDRAVAPLFGDAGSVALIKRSEEMELSWFALHTDGLGFDHIIVPAGGFRRPHSPDTSFERSYTDGNYRAPENLHMNGAEVFNFSIKEEPPAIRELLDFARIGTADVDHFIFHQANRYIIGNIARRLKIPLGKAPSQTVERYGNQSSASIPCTICDAIAGEVRSSSRRLVLSGFGVGLSWASCLLSLGPLAYCQLNTYAEKSPENSVKS